MQTLMTFGNTIKSLPIRLICIVKMAITIKSPNNHSRIIKYFYFFTLSMQKYIYENRNYRTIDLLQVLGGDADYLRLA